MIVSASSKLYFKPNTYFLHFFSCSFSNPLLFVSFSISFREDLSYSSRLNFSSISKFFSCIRFAFPFYRTLVFVCTPIRIIYFVSVSISSNDLLRFGAKPLPSKGFSTSRSCIIQIIELECLFLSLWVPKTTMHTHGPFSQVTMAMIVGLSFHNSFFEDIPSSYFGSSQSAL